jgi:predicted secreted Zn-dependent protease
MCDLHFPSRIRRASWVAGMSLALLPVSALSQIHMCKGADGRTVYSDVSCGPDAKIVEVKPSGGGGVNPIATMQVEYYDIRGTTLEALGREIASKGPEGRWWGMASTSVTYRYTTRQTPKGCVIDVANALIDTTVRLPRWVNRAEAAAAVQDRWDSASRSLELHERGHVQISMTGAQELERSMRELPEEASCDTILAAVKRLNAALQNRLHERQMKYDAETDHGRIQWSPYR